VKNGREAGVRQTARCPGKLKRLGGIKVDRDKGGACGILIRALGDTTMLGQEHA